MKKLTAVITLVIVVVMFSPGYADTKAFKEFIRQVQAEENKVGRPEIVVESAACIIFLFGLERTMKKFKFNKVEDTYEIKEIRKFDQTPMKLDQIPEAGARKVLATYGYRQQTQ